MTRTSHCALHLRARAEHMNSTNAQYITLWALPVCEAGAGPPTPGPEKHQKSFKWMGESFLDGIRVAHIKEQPVGGGANGRPQKRRILQFSLRTLALKPCSNHARTMLETLSGSTRFLLKLKFSHRVIFFTELRLVRVYVEHFLLEKSLIRKFARW